MEPEIYREFEREVRLLASSFCRILSYVNSIPIEWVAFNLRLGELQTCWKSSIPFEYWKLSLRTELAKLDIELPSMDSEHGLSAFKIARIKFESAPREQRVEEFQLSKIEFLNNQLENWRMKDGFFHA